MRNQEQTYIQESELKENWIKPEINLLSVKTDTLGGLNAGDDFLEQS